MKKEIKEIIKNDIWNNEKENIWLNSDEFKNNYEKYTTDIKGVDELKIHKMLYFLYGRFYVKFNKECIKNSKFKSYKHGPIEYNYYQKKNIDIVWENEDEKQFIIALLEKLSKLNVWRLVDLSHLTDPWIESGSGEFYENRNHMENENIKKYFKNSN